MAELLREAFAGDWTVTIDYELAPGRDNGIIRLDSKIRIRAVDGSPFKVSAAIGASGPTCPCDSCAAGCADCIRAFSSALDGSSAPP